MKGEWLGERKAGYSWEEWKEGNVVEMDCMREEYIFNNYRETQVAKASAGRPMYFDFPSDQISIRKRN